MKKLFKFLIYFSIIGGILTYIVTYHIAPYAIIMKHDITQDVDFNNFDFNAKKVNLIVQDSIVLDSYMITPKSDSIKGIMIMVHGIGSCKEPYSGIAQELANKEIGTFLFDLRAHGKSDGEYCTYGFYEKNDIKEIVDYLKLKFPNKKIGIWGASLGGAIAIQALEVDSRLEFGLIECTFTELDQIVSDYQKRICFGLGFKFITDASLKKAGEIAEFNPDEVKPIKSVKNISQPMFLAHGTKDENISFEYGKLLYENLKSKEKTFYPVQDAGHNYLHKIGGIEYQNKVMGFIDSQLIISEKKENTNSVYLENRKKVKPYKFIWSKDFERVNDSTIKPVKKLLKNSYNDVFPDFGLFDFNKDGNRDLVFEYYASSGSGVKHRVDVYMFDQSTKKLIEEPFSIMNPAYYYDSGILTSHYYGNGGGSAIKFQIQKGKIDTLEYIDIDIQNNDKNRNRIKVDYFYTNYQLKDTFSLTDDCVRLPYEYRYEKLIKN